VNLLARTIRALQDARLPCALIGATAMAVHGVARATMDVDLLLAERSALDSAAWDALRAQGVSVDIRRGGPDDPLAGVVRLEAPDDVTIDLIVGTAAWQRRILERTIIVELAGVHVPVAAAVDLVLLKLYAGSPQDRWDVQRLLAVSTDGQLREKVESNLLDLPLECRAVWRSVLEEVK
jgi:predicted nucleotidyltransferase